MFLVNVPASILSVFRTLHDQITNSEKSNMNLPAFSTFSSFELFYFSNAIRPTFHPAISLATHRHLNRCIRRRGCSARLIDWGCLLAADGRVSNCLQRTTPTNVTIPARGASIVTAVGVSFQVASKLQNSSSPKDVR